MEEIKQELENTTRKKAVMDLINGFLLILYANIVIQVLSIVFNMSKYISLIILVISSFLVYFATRDIRRKQDK